MNKKKRIALVSAVIIIVIIIGVAYFVSTGGFLGGASTQDKVYVEKVSKIMNLSTGVENRYNGVVESQNAYEVDADSSRSIKEILVEVGDTVEEGTPLATYDTSEVEMQIKLAELDLEGLQADIDSYNKQIENLQLEIAQSYDQEDIFANNTEISTIQNSIAQVELDIESKNLEIENLREQSGNATIISKYSGVVKEINENGTDTSGDSSAFMKIMQSGEYRVKGSVDEQNVWMIQEGTAVIIRSRVNEEQIWHGTLLQIDTNNVETKENDYYDDSDTQSATKYPFYVELESAEGLLLGQHVYIEMDEGQELEKSGLWLYSDYVVQEEDGAYVWAATEKNVLKKCAVTLGEYDEELMEYEIVSGLTKDDYIAWPMEGLYEGVTTVTNEDEVDYDAPLYNIESTEEYFEEYDEGYLEEYDDEEYLEEYDDEDRRKRAIVSLPDGAADEPSEDVEESAYDVEETEE